MHQQKETRQVPKLVGFEMKINPIVYCRDSFYLSAACAFAFSSHFAIKSL